MEIGSFYEIAPDVVPESGHYREKLSLAEVNKYGKANTAYTASGREAIALALKCLEREHPTVRKSCLMPAYMCDTVFFPFEQNDWELLFYHIDENMKADEQEIQALIEQNRPGLLFIHPYYGVDTWKQMRSFLHVYQDKGLLLMEDRTQSYYLSPPDVMADYIIGSLRKWYAIPDGGFLTTNHAIYEDILEQKDYFAIERTSFLTSKWEYLHGTEEAEEKQQRKEQFLRDNRRMEEWLDHTPDVTCLSPISRTILADVDEISCRARRNQNYQILQKSFANRKGIKPVFEKCVEQPDAPLYFPVYITDREEFQSYLQKHDIYAPILWPIGKENGDLLSKKEQYIYQHLLAIPMDQRYGEEQMNRIIEVLEHYEWQ